MTEQKKTRIFLDPGHSQIRPGARSKDNSIREELLNVHACNVIKSVLEACGYFVDLWDPSNDNLTAIGKRAALSDVAVSWHHNSFNKTGNPYHCIIIDPDVPFYYKERASRLCQAMADGAKGTVAETKVYAGSHGIKGVYETELLVLNVSRRYSKDKSIFHILPEAYFINSMIVPKDCFDATKKIAISFAKQLMKEFPL